MITKCKPGVLHFLLLIWIQFYVNISQALVKQEHIEDVPIVVITTHNSLQFLVNDTENNYNIKNVICKSIKNDEDDVTGNAQNICENLNPCSTYLSVITLETHDSTFEKTIDSKTDYIEPYTQIVNVEAYTDKINLTWKTTHWSCVSVFVVIAESNEKNKYQNQLLNELSYYEFDKLDPCQIFSLQLITYDNKNTFISNETTTTTTQYSEPGDVSFTITNLINGQTEILWDAPDKKTCVEFYRLRWYKADCTTISNNDIFTTEPNTSDEIYDECDWYVTLINNDNSVQYFLANLQGCEDYVVELYINQNDTAKGKQDFTSAEKIPSDITKENLVVSATDIEIHWSTPNHSKCLLLYLVTITGPFQRDDNITVVETFDNYAFFYDLDPCGQYELNITPKSLNGSSGESIHEFFITAEAQPTKIMDPNIEAGPYTLNISWSKPTFSDLCLTGYRLEGWRDDNMPVEALSKETSATNVVYDKGLNSCQAYILQIIPTTKTMDGEPIQIEAETGAAVVDADMTVLQVVTTFSDSLELSARSTDVTNTCQTIFAHFFCKTSTNVPFSYAEKWTEGHVGDISFKASLGPLSSYTDYNCYCNLYNIAGKSNDKRIIHKTEAYFPDSPEDVGLANASNSSLIIHWKSPTYSNGNIKLYILHFQRYEANYFIPPRCMPMAHEASSPQTSSLQHTFPSLLPSMKYTFQVAAQNEVGLSQYTKPRTYVTLPWVSEPVTNLKVSVDGPYPTEEKVYKASVNVSWSVPCKSNGKIEFFQLKFIGERIDHTSHQFARNVLPKFDDEGNMLYNETDLQPEFNYTLKITVKTEKIEALSDSAIEYFDAPAGIPKSLSEVTVAKTQINVFETNHPQRSAKVRIPSEVLQSDSGNIIYMALLLSEKDCTGIPQLKYSALNSNEDWPNIASWQEVHKDACQQYQTTPLRWKPTTTLKANEMEHKYGRNTDEEIVYIIGDDKCTDNGQRFCNGPLKAETTYNLVIRLFTKNGFNDAAILEFKTDSAIQVTVILIACCCCLILAFIIGLVVLWVRKRIAWHRDSGQGIEDPFGNITAKNFAIFYSEISKHEKLTREFKELTVVALELSHVASELGCHKNRYADIFPYDKNRVILDIDADGSDYINASFIDGYTRKKEYIATQGPKPESTLDFWRMILQHNVKIIVQVTQFREGPQVKCHEYFPYVSKGINVVRKNKETFEIYDRTEMSVYHDKYGLKQKVVHFYFKKWPDHGCPDDPLHLINFIRKVKAEKRPSYSPIVVHCSAGVGRTGTFIGLDIVMQRLKSESKINIFDTVKKLRFQRMRMVQNFDQYQFLYKCVYSIVRQKFIPKNT